MAGLPYARYSKSIESPSVKFGGRRLHVSEPSLEEPRLAGQAVPGEASGPFLLAHVGQVEPPQGHSRDRLESGQRKLVQSRPLGLDRPELVALG